MISNEFEELDPSLADGFKLIYENEVPIELRLHDPETGPQEVGELKTIKIKILSQEKIFRMELTSEEDLFFFYSSLFDEATYQKIKSEQNLNIDFAGYINSLIKMFNNCHREPQKFFCVLFMQRDGYARLDFIQNMEYKFLELFSLDLLAASEEIIRSSITFRYNRLKAKFWVIDGKLREVNALIKLKNPSLLVQLQKNMGGKGGGKGFK